MIEAKTVNLTTADQAYELANFGPKAFTLNERDVLTVKNADGAAAVALGGSDVTTANAGIVLAAGDSATLEFTEGGSLFAVSGTADVDVQVLRGAAVTHYVAGA